MKRLVRDLVARALAWLLDLVPKAPLLVVSSWPVTEANGIEVVRRAAQTYPGRVVWLMDDPDAVELNPLYARVERVRKKSWAGMRAYLRAETIMFTHGLYGPVRPRTRRVTVVNLWHGDGFKRKDVGGARSTTYPAHLTVGSSRELTVQRCIDFHMPVKAALVTGTPRTAGLAHPMPAELERAVLGLEPGQPFVLWLPTFRRARQTSTTGESWHDGGDATSLADHGRRMAEALAARGIALILKPHPLDADLQHVPGVRLVDDALLLAHGTTLYEVMAGARGLVTDYSSVWTEFLLLDRPLGFCAPDLEEYAAGRGLHMPELVSDPPGYDLTTDDGLAAYADELEHGAPLMGERRAGVRVALGTQWHDDPVGGLFRALGDDHSFRRTEALHGPWWRTADERAAGERSWLVRSPRPGTTTRSPATHGV